MGRGAVGGMQCRHEGIYLFGIWSLVFCLGVLDVFVGVCMDLAWAFINIKTCQEENEDELHRIKRRYQGMQRCERNT